MYLTNNIVIYRKSPNSGYWSNDGCHVISTNSSHTHCQCNHLTHFAILVRISDTKVSTTTDV